MRIVVVGAGGTGGYFGGLLARAGEEVTFLTRGVHLEALRRHGLTVKSRLAGDFTLAVSATDTLIGMEPVDLILFCVKTYDTTSAAELIRSLVGPQTMILSVQNGIHNAERIEQIVGPDHAIGAVAFVVSQIDSPGVITQTAGPGRIRFGELQGGTSERTEGLLRTFQQAGIDALLDTNIRIALWEKFLFICAFSGVTTLTRLPLGPLLSSQESRSFLREVMVEVEAVARASGIGLSADCVDRQMAFLVSNEPWARGSMYFDLAANRRLEIEDLNGTVVRLGQTLHISTPLNFAIYASLKPYQDGRPPIGEQSSA